MVTAVSGTVFIAAGAFWLSFTALADLAARSGIGAGQAWAWPLIVDGIIVVATVAVVALARHKSAWYPWVLLIGGAAVSVTANAIHAVVAADADVPGVLAAAVAAVPPVVLLAITHLTVILTRPLPTATDPDTDTDTGMVALDRVALVEQPTQPSAPVEAPEPSLLPVPASAEPAADGDSAPVAPPPVVESTRHTRAGVTRSDRRERAAKLREQGWSNKRIARELGVHPSTVGRWFTHAHLPDKQTVEEAKTP
ncbi:DUF2637 domain-containing protein [Ornithinimicrobium sufpigmenti]|uniref:DUF2637 domain-containing protein n=1 Tax=Candidatus Ruania gallistercoris TaxID=2838746 RepID=A0A9D2EFV4_9MICO|nr:MULTISPECIES: DUF2637 domain-containing protein [unclassified Ornithinimicrobium]HIZ36702.1 DUF2637 domain-containing protein [Candidatus Ruania gallistercoris]